MTDFAVGPRSIKHITPAVSIDRTAEFTNDPARSTSSRAVTSFETWFGPSDAPLFGSVHLPSSGEARGAAVLCAPLGKEHITTYRGMRQLAERLSAAGLMVLRFDYRGQGDSSGDQLDPESVSNWLSSIEQAVGYVRAAGADRVSLVGLRAGALLASQVAATVGPLESVVLWDPVLSGRSYMREQRALYKMTIGDDDPADASVSILGAVFDPEGAARLESLRIAADDVASTSAPVLCLVRPEDLDSRPVRKLVETTSATLDVAPSQSAFVNPPSFVFSVPTDTVDHVALWISQHQGDATSAVAPSRSDTARVHVRPDGVEVFESIEYRGRDHLLAITTHVESRHDSDAQVVMHGTASEHRIGPVRLWVESARRIATSGVGAIRFDRRGTGDSETVAVNESTSPMSVKAREDVASIVGSLEVPTSSTVHVGMCSGSWHSAYAAQQFGAAAVVLVNTVAWSLRRKRQPVKAATVTAMDSKVASGLFVVAKRVRNAGRVAAKKIPYPVWRAMGSAGVIEVPETMLDSLLSKGVRVEVMLSPDDVAHFRTQRGEPGLQRLRSRGSDPHVDVYAEGDHSLYHRDLRGTVSNRILTTVAEVFDAKVDVPQPPVSITARAL
ncbi:hypothetical protein GCM10007304_47560 [Rhodococcoides trifolii]|uniref:Serine aminopeptidase S33 domain-containing protein n=1 Tax=Rhodococcoides trifolii TaxID=908250 RepID=A0A917G904_9NOCA|nr:alpha/beta hydrolase [Rhodococcus trifolii]GGG28227.1 hypothetical protein GCM10007304_47560 [Rhodococcus trifolii]